MPTTSPSNEFGGEEREQARDLDVEATASGRPRVKPPIWKSENAAGCSVSHSASVAAIFIGWASVTTTPNSLPTPSCTTETGSDDDHRQLGRVRKTSTFRPRRKCQQETPSTRKPRGHESDQDDVHPGEEDEALEEDLADVVASARPVCELSS